jgi:hypothetical protein
MKINIEGTEYEIDIERATELGICKKVPQKRKAPQIENIEIGDVFENYITRVLIVKGVHKHDERCVYNIAWLDGLKLSTDFEGNGVTKEELIDWLNEREYSFVKNINDEVAELIDW